MLKKNKTITAGLIVVLSILIFTSCGGESKGQDEIIAPKGMTYQDISKTGMNLFVLTPDSAKAPLEAAQESWGGYKMIVGKDFQIVVSEDEGNIASKKEDLKNDDVNIVKQYIIDEPTTLMWESGIGDLSEFHFYHIAKVGNRSYVFEDLKGELFTKDAIQKMLDACKQVKEKVIQAK